MEFLWHFSHTQKETSRLNYCDEKCSRFSSINIQEWLVSRNSHFEIYSWDFAIMNILKMSVFYCFSLFSFCTAEHFDKKGSRVLNTHVFSYQRVIVRLRFKNCFSDNAEKSEFLKGWLLLGKFCCFCNEGKWKVYEISTLTNTRTHIGLMSVWNAFPKGFCDKRTTNINDDKKCENPSSTVRWWKCWEQPHSRLFVLSLETFSQMAGTLH